jgi:hypothetical protein
MKKTISIIALLIVLCGCMKVDINYIIDEKHNVKLSYHIVFDEDKIDRGIKSDVMTLINDTAKKYENAGFTVTIKENGTDYTFTLEKKAASYEEAFKILEEIITNPEISIFLVADIHSSTEEYEQAFGFYFETDLGRILESTGTNKLPPTIRAEINEALNESTVNFTVTLPQVNVVAVNEDVIVETKNKKTTFTLPMNWEGTSVMDFTARMSLDNNKMTPHTMEDSIQNTENQIGLYQALFYGGVGASVISSGVLVYSKIIKKKEVVAKEGSDA